MVGVLILFILTIILSVLYYYQRIESRELRHYISSLEQDNMQKQIKLEEIGKRAATSSNSSFTPLAVFNDLVNHATYECKRNKVCFCILFFNVQNYNQLTDTMDEESKQALHKEIATRLQSTIRKVDTLSHVKEGNFILLLTQLMKPESAAYVAHRIMKNFKSPLAVNQRALTIKSHIGISAYPSDGEELNLLLENAENAYEYAKLKDIFYYFHNQTLQRANEKEVQISNILRVNHLPERIATYCLPQVNLTNQNIIGIKIIPFLKDEYLGLIPYDEFVEIAEKENKLVAIYTCCITEAITCFNQWKNMGKDPKRLAMSISIHLIQNDEFIQQLSDILAKNNFNPQDLTFEIMFDNLMQDTGLITEAFQKINKIGIKICLNIYTLGQLAIHKITDLPISYLKIDENLVKEMILDNEKVLPTLLNLSKNMGLETLVEGIDTERQKIHLEHLGFYIMQGKLFGEYRPIHEFTF